MIEKYDIEYMGVKCTGVDWTHPVNNVFYFTKDGQNYTYMQTEYISSSADTDHIRCVIEEQFLPWWKDQRIKELEAENADLKNRLSKSNEECLKWHERAQNLIKENGGSISGYELTIAELKASLDKSVYVKAKLYDTVYLPWIYDGVSGVGELTVCAIHFLMDGSVIYLTDIEDVFPEQETEFLCKYYYGNFSQDDFGVMVFTNKQAAESRLAEIKGEQK